MASSKPLPLGNKEPNKPAGGSTKPAPAGPPPPPAPAALAGGGAGPFAPTLTSASALPGGVTSSSMGAGGAQEGSNLPSALLTFLSSSDPGHHANWQSLDAGADPDRVQAIADARRMRTEIERLDAEMVAAEVIFFRPPEATQVWASARAGLSAAATKCLVGAKSTLDAGGPVTSKAALTELLRKQEPPIELPSVWELGQLAAEALQGYVAQVALSKACIKELHGIAEKVLSGQIRSSCGDTGSRVRLSAQLSTGVLDNILGEIRNNIIRNPLVLGGQLVKLFGLSHLEAFTVFGHSVYEEIVQRLEKDFKEMSGDKCSAPKLRAAYALRIAKRRLGFYQAHILHRDRLGMRIGRNMIEWKIFVTLVFRQSEAGAPWQLLKNSADVAPSALDGASSSSSSSLASAPVGGGSGGRPQIAISSIFSSAPANASVAAAMAAPMPASASASAPASSPAPAPAAAAPEAEFDEETATAAMNAGICYLCGDQELRCSCGAKREDKEQFERLVGSKQRALEDKESKFATFCERNNITVDELRVGLAGDEALRISADASGAGGGSGGGGGGEGDEGGAEGGGAESSAAPTSLKLRVPAETERNVRGIGAFAQIYKREPGATSDYAPLNSGEGTGGRTWLVGLGPYPLLKMQLNSCVAMIGFGPFIGTDPATMTFGETDTATATTHGPQAPGAREIFASLHGKGLAEVQGAEEV